MSYSRAMDFGRDSNLERCRAVGKRFALRGHIDAVEPRLCGCEDTAIAAAANGFHIHAASPSAV